MFDQVRVTRTSPGVSEVATAALRVGAGGGAADVGVALNQLDSGPAPTAFVASTANW